MSTSTADLITDEPVFPEMETGKARRLDYLGYAPCPIRNELRRRLHRRFEEERIATGLEPAWFMPVCEDDNPYEEIWNFEADLMPSLITEGGVADVFRPEFISKWVDSGFYGGQPPLKLRPEFAAAGMEDPTGVYQIYGVFPRLLLVDLKKLAGRPVPASWEDLLHPRFANDIIIGGEDGEIPDFLLFNLHKTFGEAGLSALGPNIKDFWSSAQMVKAAGADHPRGAAVYVLPWFFAAGSPNLQTTARLVWPRDGALSMPLFKIGRREPTPAAKVASDFLSGPEWTAHMERVGFPPSVTHTGAALPGPVKWLGWDYLRTGELDALRGPLNAIVFKARQG